MRQRRAKNLEEKVEALASYQVENPQKFFGRWQEFFGNQNPIYLEIGCGKGQFALRQALAHPNRNYIAVEGQISVALRAMEKAALAEQQTGRRNLVIICAFVNDIGELFQEGELAGIYLNFSDPWPKDRHYKRRLTYRSRLMSYMKALMPEGFIEIKTDNDNLFAFTQEEADSCSFLPVACVADLYGDTASSGSTAVFLKEAIEITTEYEDKFRSQGLPIHYMRLEKK